MNFLFNDLSFHKQFSNTEEFKQSVSKIMQIREKIQASGRIFFCGKNIINAEVHQSLPLPKIIQELDLNQKRSFISWIHKFGPYWESERNHSPDDYLESNGEIVTDTVLGEAAWFNFNGTHRGLISIEPSNWNFTPIIINRLNDSEVVESTAIMNFWEVETIEKYLSNLPTPIKSWKELELVTIQRFKNLTFFENSFLPLRGIPFSLSASERIYLILEILNKMKSCFDETGARTQEGHEIYQNFFTGKKSEGGRGSIFSDSSDTEKKDFENELLFYDPLHVIEKISCPWHGKVQTPQLRVHFSMPIRAEEPLYITYVGEKLTKR